MCVNSKIPVINSFQVCQCFYGELAVIAANNKFCFKTIAYLWAEWRIKYGALHLICEVDAPYTGRLTIGHAGDGRRYGRHNATSTTLFPTFYVSCHCLKIKKYRVLISKSSFCILHTIQTFSAISFLQNRVLLLTVQEVKYIK